ncbi:uncharacterized protein [Centruroides vittatus]|uniref:uncharacterized protein n=1 Tax=Centruroides vittatus TaxID=120091 RepID=UPI0035107FB4
MSTAKKALQWFVLFVGFLGIAALGIGIWNLSFPPRFKHNEEIVVKELGLSPKLTVATGILMMLLSIGLCCYDLEKRKYPIIIGLLLLLIIASCLSAMSIAIKDYLHERKIFNYDIDDMNEYAKYKYLHIWPQRDVQLRFKVIAITNGFSLLVLISATITSFVQAASL